MLHVLSSLVLSLLAAAQLGRWHGAATAPRSSLKRCAYLLHALAPLLRAPGRSFLHNGRVGLTLTFDLGTDGARALWRGVLLFARRSRLVVCRLRVARRGHPG